MNFEEDIIINKFNLEYELIRQSGIFMKFSEKYAGACVEKKKKDLQRKILKAEISKEIRLSEEIKKKYSGKLTEGVIEGELRTDPRYEEISLELIEAEEEILIFEAVKTALQQKKNMLEEYNQGRIAGIYSTPNENKKRRRPSEN